MEPALKQRLVGAAVLVAIAVIFLPMLIKGPAPESGVSDVSLELPPAPGNGFETRELPLVTPQAPSGAAVTGMGTDVAGESAADGALPTVDTRDDRAAADAAADEVLPPTAAGGNHAVSFGSYATADDAQRVVRALLDSQLPGYAEAVTANGRTLHRVRIGPYASRAEAENARLRAAHVRDDVGAKVVTLDADAATPAAASASQPAAAPAPAVSRPEPLPEAPPARTVAGKPATTTPPTAPAPARTTPAPTPKPAVATSKPVAAPPPAAVAPAAATPAASSVGFAVQLGAFGSQAEALKLRDRARGAGLSAFVEDVNTDKGRLSRVQLGPVADRAAAEQLKAQAASRLGVNGFVRPHP